MNKYAILSAVIIMGIIASETMIVIAQEQIDSTDSDKQKIIVTWLEANETNTESDPTIIVSSEDFWETFKPLVELSINGSTLSSK
jgi:hypothetical protein